MPDGGFDVDSIFRQATQGKLPTSAPPGSGVSIAPAASQDGIQTMTIRPNAPPQTQEFDPEAIFRQAVKGELKEPPPLPQPPSGSTGISGNVAAGANQAIFGALGGPIDASNWIRNKAASGINAVAGTDIKPTENPPGGSQSIANLWNKMTGVNPYQVEPTNELESMAQGAGGALAEVPLMGIGAAGAAPMLSGAARGVAGRLTEGAGAGSVGQMARTGVQAATGGAVGQGLEDVAPEPLKPVANLAGNMLGAGGVAGAERLGRAAPSLLPAQVGLSKENIGGIKATGAQIQQTGQGLNEALGPEGRANVTNAVDNNQLELVPGSHPTTGEIAGTAGAQDLEAQARVTNGPQFVQRAQERNNARVGAIQDLEPTQANPMTIGQKVADQLSKLDQTGQANVASAKAGVEGQSILGAGNPENNGQIRTALKGAAQPWIQAYRKAWALVDPDGTWAIQSQPLKDRAAELMGQASPTANNDAQVSALMQRGSSLPSTIKFSDLSQMRQDANEAIARLSSGVGNRSQIFRAQAFKEAIDQTIAHSIDAKTAVDPELSEKLETVLSAGSEESANDRRLLVVAQQGTPAAAQRQPASVAPRLTPNVGEENVEQYAAANKATADYKQQYGQGGVGAILRPGSNFQEFNLPEGRVASQIFTRSGTEPAEVQRFIQAMGGPDKAEPLARDALVNELREKNIVDKVSGAVNEKKLADWRAARAGTLEQFPNLARQFGSLESAQRTLTETTAQHVQALKQFQDSVAARLVGADPRNAVQKVLAGANPEANMQQLVQQVRGDPDAVASLKRMFVDYIVDRHSSATPSTDGFDMLKAGGLRDWINRYKGPLRVLFGGQGMQNLEMVGADLRRQAMPPTALAGSQTAPHMVRMARAGSGSHSPSTTLLALVGEHIGSAMHGAGGIVGAGVGMIGGNMWRGIQEAGIHTRNDLNAYAMLHPEVAKGLMERADASALARGAVQNRINSAFKAAITADMTRQNGVQKQ